MSADWRDDLAVVLAGRAAVKRDEPLSGHTTFRIGGPAEAWVEVEDQETLAAVVRFCSGADVPMRVLGRGSNVLVSDQGLRGAVIHLAGELARIDLDARPTRVGAGVLLDEIADAAEVRGLAGADFLAGIPGTLGGGLGSNAGAYGRALGEIVESVTAIDGAGKAVVLDRDRLRNEYRTPVVPDGLFVLEAALQLEPGHAAPARELRKQRWGKHPKEPSAGSFFKNPAHEPAGRLIDRCGLKGTRVGAAGVSELHGNFIVNHGGARFGDVYELAQVVKAHVEAETGIELVEEVRVLPEVEPTSGPDTGTRAGPAGPKRRQTNG